MLANFGQEQTLTKVLVGSFLYLLLYTKSIASNIIQNLPQI
jgi:hypothetical protein